MKASELIKALSLYPDREVVINAIGLDAVCKVGSVKDRLFVVTDEDAPEIGATYPREMLRTEDWLDECSTEVIELGF